jgi:small subunit ribosomal protein S18
MAAKSRRGKVAPGPQPARARGGLAPPKRKSCLLCKGHVTEVDYKNVDLLRRYTSDRGKIRTRRMTGACRRHQRQVAVAIKRAREMALLPYIGANDSPPRSGGHRDGRGGSGRRHDGDA